MQSDKIALLTSHSQPAALLIGWQRHVQVDDPGAPETPTWMALDHRLDEVAARLREADSKDDLQDVGRRCREILIDAGKLLADPSLIIEGQEAPKAGDAKTWLDLFLASRASGGSHKTLRVFIRAAWDLAQTVTHGDVQRADAYAAAQATVLIVRTLQQLDQQDVSRIMEADSSGTPERFAQASAVKGRADCCAATRVTDRGIVSIAFEMCVAAIKARQWDHEASACPAVE